MAKPDLDDGYLRVAHELFAAIALAGFSKWEMVVLREVFDQIYGPAKSKVARLSPTDVATRAGTYKESIVRAIRTLVAAGVLVKTAEGEYRFIKDYDAWRHGERPRFSPSESTYCASAKRIKASTPDGNNGAPTHKRIRGTSALPTGTDALPDGEQMRSPSGTDALPWKSSPPDPP
ncbi:MAG TPA: replication protein [Fimbriimonadaceae bacterium]|nr:replication protein [Fimbriimonadaceae bacterium]